MLQVKRSDNILHHVCYHFIILFSVTIFIIFFQHSCYADEYSREDSIVGLVNLAIGESQTPVNLPRVWNILSQISKLAGSLHGKKLSKSETEYLIKLGRSKDYTFRIQLRVYELLANIGSDIDNSKDLEDIYASAYCDGREGGQVEADSANILNRISTIRDIYFTIFKRYPNIHECTTPPVQWALPLTGQTVPCDKRFWGYPARKNIQGDYIRECIFPKLLEQRSPDEVDRIVRDVISKVSAENDEDKQIEQLRQLLSSPMDIAGLRTSFGVTDFQIDSLMALVKAKKGSVRLKLVILDGLEPLGIRASRIASSLKDLYLELECGPHSGISEKYADRAWQSLSLLVPSTAAESYPGELLEPAAQVKDLYAEVTHELLRDTVCTSRN